MTRKTKLVLAWDKSTHTNQDDELLCQLLPYFDMVKVGLEAISAEDAFCRSVANVVWRRACMYNKQIFWDGKFDDTQNTVLGATRAILKKRVALFTLHAQISNDTLRAVSALCKNTGTLPVAVTVLTDLDQAECYARFQFVPELAVFNFTRMVRANGIRALTCAGHEIAYLRDAGLLEDMVTIVPGIYSSWAKKTDQKRTVTPARAVELGADYIVVGRQVTDPPPGMTCQEAAEKTREELEAAK